MPVVSDCEILQAHPLSPYGFSLTLSAKDLALAAKPGQFVHIACGDGTLLRRPLGISGAIRGRIFLVYETRGAGTKALSRLQAGGTLSVLGPLGNGFDLSGQNILLAGGGLGCSPLLFAATRLSLVDAVIGFRSADRVLLADAFRAACREVDLCTDDGSLGLRSYVDAQVRRRLKMRKYDRVLTCGPAVMMRAVAAAAAAAGVPCQVSLESRMGCGVGACLVCACARKNGEGYAHVCKDGPIFDAEEVDWDA